MKKRRKWLAGFLAFAVTMQSVGTFLPVKAETAEGDIVFADFEGETLNSNASGSLTKDEKHGGEQALKYDKTGDYKDWNVEITTNEESGSVDVSGQKYLSFWLKDEKSNDLAVKLIDANGKDAEKWTEMKSTEGEWSHFYVPLSEYGGIDLTAIQKVAFYEWNEGIYYIDDICFTSENGEAQEPEKPTLDGEPAWFQDFEAEDTSDTFEFSSTGVTASVDEGVGCEKDGSATKGLVYEKEDSSSPEKTDGSIVIKSDSPVDASRLRYLIFYIKDMQGSNTLKVSLIDADGKETDFGGSGWCEVKTVKEKWKQYAVPLEGRSGKIDWTRVTGIRIGEWNAGTYYIDNVYFDNYLFTGTPDSGITVPEVASGEVKPSVEPGKGVESRSVELIAEKGAEIYYTLDGTEPTIESTKYTGALEITGSTVIKAIAVKSEGTPGEGTCGEVYTFTYEIVPYPVTATSEPGTYTDSAVVEFRTKNDKDLIYYTTDGSVPVRNEGTAEQFIKPMLVTESTTFKAVAYDAKTGSVNDAAELAYIIEKSGETAAPVFSKPEGTYGKAIEVELLAEGDIYYTTDGSEPTTDSAKYESAVNVDKAMKLRAIAVADGKESEIAEAVYTIHSEASPFLKADGKVLKDNYGTGDVITLRGTNAGGWLVTEDWQCPTNAKDQLTAQRVFTERFGAETAQELIDYYQDNWWTEEDFDLVKAEGMNMLRLPITYFEMLNEDGSLKDTAFDRLEWFVENCEKRGLYVLIDMHGAVGSQNGKDHSGDITIPDVGDFYGNEENINKTIELWKVIAEKYKDNPWVCGYDLLNEPSAVGTVQFEVYDRIYKAIRAIDKNHVMYMQAIWEPTHLPDPSFYGWQNVAYEYHFYGWDVEKDVEGQKKFIESKVKMVNEDTNYDVPLLVGEFTFFSVLDSWNAMDLFEEEGWSYTTWTYKVTGEGSSWGIFTSGHAKVDIYKDSVETIKEKWAPEKLNTSSFVRNDEIADKLKTYFANNEKNKPGTTAATGISLTKELSIERDKTASLNAKTVPDNTAYPALKFTTSDPAVADVDADGVITAKATGTATITVTNLYGMKEKAVVTVKAAGSTGGDTGGGNKPGDGNQDGGNQGGNNQGGADQTAPDAVTGLMQSKSDTKSVSVSWTGVKNADGYEVTFVDGKTEAKSDTTKNNASFSSLKAGSVYTVKVRAYIKSGNTKLYGKEAVLTVTTMLDKKPASVKAAQSAKSKVKLTWKKAAGASGYEIYMKTGKGSYKKVSTVKGASKVAYTKSGLKKNSTYTFRIRAYKTVGTATVYSDYQTAKAVTIKTWLAKPASFKVKKSGSAAKISWKKVSGASGYEVYMKTGKGKYKKVGTVKGASKKTFTKKGLKKNKTYTFKVRAYKGSGKSKAVSRYTAEKTVKMK